MDTGALWLSLQVSLIATAIAALTGLLGAVLLRSPRVPARELIDALLTAPMVLPPTVLGYYLLVLLGRRSLLGQSFEALSGSPIAFTFGGAVIAASVGAFPLVLKSARAALDSLDPVYSAAARTLGASPLRSLLLIEIPLARRGLLAGIMLGFARALGDFGMTLIVAGNIPGETRTAPLAIYDALQAGRDGDALGLSLLLTAVALAVLYLVNQLGRAHGR